MKLNNEVHEMKNKYYILDSHYKNANTPEFGFGDFPQKTRYVKCIVFAETKRKAQNIFKKHYGKDKTFGGYFGYQIKHESENFTDITLNRTGNALTDTFPTLKEVFTSEFKTLPHTIDLSVLPYEMSKEVEKQYEGGE